MKARVKATGEIIEVYQSSYNLGEFYDTETGTETYDVSELELLGTIIPITTEEIPDYWTRLEHQYAGMAMQGMMAHTNIDYDEIVDLCVEFAHTLVEKMKEERK
jgi:hypothetical protein